MGSRAGHTLTVEQTMQVLEILALQNDVELRMNVPINDNYSNVYDILILRCNIATTKALIAKDYSLAMSKKGLYITKF